MVDQVPPSVVVGEPEVGIAGQHLGDDRGQPGAADHHEVVAVQVDQAGRSDDLVLGLQPKGAGQLTQPLVGLEAFLGDDRAGLLLVGLQLGAKGDGELAVAEEQAFAAWPGGQELSDPSPGHAQVVGELGLGHALGDELLDRLPANAGELVDGCLVAGQQLARLLRLLQRVLKLSNGLNRRVHSRPTSPPRSFVRGLYPEAIAYLRKGA